MPPADSAICLTFNIDWAPEPVLDDLFGLLASHRVKATVFATHDSAGGAGRSLGRP